MDDRRRRCARCGHVYRESENGEAACRYHPGQLRDYDRLAAPGVGAPGDFWDCCKQQIAGHPLDAPGCATGRHEEADPTDPGPVKRDLHQHDAGFADFHRRFYAKECAAAKDRLVAFARGEVDDAFRARSDVRILENADLEWLVSLLTAPAYPAERRHLLASEVGSAGRDRLRAAAGAATPLPAAPPGPWRPVFRIRPMGRWGHLGTYSFDSGEVTIGGDPVCTLSVTENIAPLAGCHTRIVVRDRRALLSDVATEGPSGTWAGGTRRNGRFVLDDELADGDQLEAGAVSFTFEIDRIPAGEEPELGFAGEGSVPAVWPPGIVLLGRYHVGEAFEGGMGRVHRVRHHRWNVDLAVKSPRPDYYLRPEHRVALFREARTWIELSGHPHVAPCLFVQTLGGVPRLFAEWIGGGTLADWIASGRLYEGGPPASLARIRDVLLGTARGLAHAHGRGVIHQDVKPANVLLTVDGVAKVADFGLANARRGVEAKLPPDPRRTVWASFHGCTPAYCSPEQTTDERLTQRTDVWSWALVVLEMFSGERGWPSGVLAPDVLRRLVASGPARTGPPPMPPALAAVLARCFTPSAKRPRDIEPIATEAAAAIDAVLGEHGTRPAPPVAWPTAATLNNAAITLAEMNAWTDAEKAWADAEALDPAHPETRFNRAVTRFRRGVCTARDAEQELAKIAGPPGRREQLTALFLLERAETAAAIALLEPLRRAHPDDPEIALAHDRALRWGSRPAGFTPPRPGAWQASLEPSRASPVRC